MDTLQAEATTELGGLIQGGTRARFLVLNPLGWPRTDAADFAYTGTDEIHVRDLAAGADVPHQFAIIGGARFLHILASDVPSAGYKIFKIVPGRGLAPTDDAATLTGGTLEKDAGALLR